MATASASGSSHLGVTENQKRWLVAGIALNKILIPQIRPFVEQGINAEYNNLKISHNIHGQSTPGRLQRWPARKVLKYENINGNDVHPRLPGGRFNYSLFDCRVMSHVDLARLYVENYMAHFTAFDDHCDASAVLTLLGGVPVFSAAVQTAAGDVRMGRNDWAHCVFSKWDEVKFQQSFIDMEHLVRAMVLPTADERKVLGELNDWETKGTHLCMNPPVDPALLQLVKQELKSLQDSIKNMSVEFEEEKRKVQHELQNVFTTLEEMEQRMHTVETGQQNLEQRTGILEGRIEDFEGNVNQRMERLESSQQSTESRTMLVEEKVHHLQGDVNQKMRKFESSQQSTEDKVHHLKGDVQQRVERIEVSQQSTASRTMLVEHKVHHLQEQVEDLTLSMESNVSTCQDNSKPAVYPENLVELIRRDYKGAVLCPFPWCEDDLQLELSNIFTRLKIVSRKKERAKLTDDIVNMTDVFKPRKECDKPRVVLIEGQPGMGKTTYCQKLAYDWSVEDIAPEASFPEVKMLLLLKCRHMKTSNIEEAIDDQLLPQDADKKEKENFFQFIRCSQSKILFVLDGLDEFPPDLFESFLPLIQGRVFSNVYLLLTARHEAGIKVRRYCDTLLEIVGYTSEDADSYITKYFSNHENPSLAKKMIKKLSQSPHLRELTANPLNTALLCLVCEDARGMFPSNRTKLYDDLVSCVLRRYHAKMEIPLDDNDPIEACADQLNQLGKLALEALLKSQLAFSEGELKGKSTTLVEFGFLSREASVSKIKPMSSYAFTHKTFQEYFAAFHLAHELLTGDKAGKDTLLAQLSPVDKYWQVWEFLFTMVATKSNDMAVLLVSSLCASFHHEIPENLSRYYPLQEEEEEEEDDEGKEEESDGDGDDDYMFYDDTSYLDETDDDDDEDDGDDDSSDDDGFAVDFCKDTSWDRDEENRLLGKEYWTQEKFLFGTLYLIGQCEQDKTRLKDYQKKMASTLARCFPMYKLKVGFTSSCTLVFSEYLKANCELTDLFWYDSLDELALSTIKHVLQSRHKLVHLHLRTDLRIASLTPALQSNRTLTHLNLRFARIRIAGATALGEVLQSNCTLTHLNLHANMIGYIGAEALAKGLQSNNVLKYLDISCNSIGDQGAVALAHVLESNRTLTYLDVGFFAENMEGVPDFFRPSSDFDDVRSEFIGESGALAVAYALRSNCSLTYLDLRGNHISDSAVVALGQALQSNCTLTHFFLRSMFRPNEIQIGIPGAAALAKALQSSGTQLTRLFLSNTSINSSSAIVLAEALHSNRNLERLDLSCNQIEYSGAAKLAKALQSNRALTHLQLRENNIGDLGATEFAKALPYNDTLTFLDLHCNGIGKLGVENLKQLMAFGTVLILNFNGVA
ncbi:hypothetical protein ACROYT_G002733 [Oculina patagonica]